MRSTIAMSSLRKDSPRTFLAAHDSAYSKPFFQIDCCIRLPRFSRGSVRILAYSRDSSLFSHGRSAFGKRLCTQIDVGVWSRGRYVVWLRMSRLHSIDSPGCTRPKEGRVCPCTRMKTACVAVNFVTSSRVSRRFRGGFSFNAGLRDLGDALSPAKANLLDGNTWVKCSPRMVYGPMVPTSCRHAALPPFSLSFCLAPRVFVPLPPTRELILSLSLSLSASPPCPSHSRHPFRVHCTLSLCLASFHETPDSLLPRATAILRPAQRRGIRTVEARTR